MDYSIFLSDYLFLTRNDDSDFEDDSDIDDEAIEEQR